MPISRSFYFIRHGQTDWNVEGRMQGQTDIPLNDIGREQAKAAIPYFQKLEIGKIYSSPLKRALETAQIIGQAIQVPVITHDDLRERHFGSNEGQLTADIRAEYDKNPNMPIQLGITGFPHAQDSETLDNLFRRILNVVNDILQMNQDKNILITAHGAIYKALTHNLLGQYIQSDNAVPYFFEKQSDQKWNIQKVTI